MSDAITFTAQGSKVVELPEWQQHLQKLTLAINSFVPIQVKNDAALQLINGRRPCDLAFNLETGKMAFWNQLNQSWNYLA